MTPYQAPAWLPGGHAQTIYPLLIKRAGHPYRRERWETLDEDFIDLDWSETRVSPARSAATPLVILFHGLEGNSKSHYSLSLMHALASIGWDGVVIHFRGCSGEPNRLPRAYHAGDSEEIDWILQRMRIIYPERPIFTVGVSLGANVLLKWLGERGTSATHLIRAAAAVSTPFDLALCGHHLGLGFNRVYSKYFLGTLKPGAEARLERFPGLYDKRRLREATTLYEFDDIVTSPLHGFCGVEDYWRRASSKPWLAAIRLPTLVLNARNDPFLPARALPEPGRVASGVTLEFSRQGGHAGFVNGPLPGKLDWLPHRILEYFKSTMEHSA